MFAPKISVEAIEPDGPRPCPLAWLDSFCMRGFAGRLAFDETLPVAPGQLEVSLPVDLEGLRRDLGDWLTRKFGEGQPTKLRLTDAPRENS